jgi:hypothetical protein
MNRQKFNEKWGSSQGHGSSTLGSILNIAKAGSDNSPVGFIANSFRAGSSLNKKINGVAKNFNNNTRTEKQRDWLLVRLDECKMRLRLGKKKMALIVPNPIRATVAELESLENEVKEAKTMDELKTLGDRTSYALGWGK